MATQPLTKTTEAQAGTLRMTYEEFLAWAGEDVHAEWVNGEVIVHMPPKDPHQRLVAFLHHIIGLFVHIFDRGRLYLAPFEVKLSADVSREPDLIFLAKEQDRKSTRLNSSHGYISYAVFCLVKTHSRQRVWRAPHTPITGMGGCGETAGA